MGRVTVAPPRDHIPGLAALGVTPHQHAVSLVYDSTALSEAFGGSGIRDFFASSTVLLASCAACIGGLLFGFDQGLLSISLTMPAFLERFPETDETITSSASLNKGVMVALLELGAFLGALMAGYVADRYSRKASIVFGMIWFIIGSVLQAASFSSAQLVIGRFIGGIGVGVLSSTAPMYISEVAPPNIRGSLLVLEHASIVFGVIVMYYITYGTRHIEGDASFRIPFALQMAPCLPLAIAIVYLPYSPRWLALRGRDRDCLDSLCRLRQVDPSDPRVQAEWITIRAEAVRNREVQVALHPDLCDGSSRSEIRLEIAGWLEMFKPGVLRQTVTGILLMWFQQFSGINALVYYAPSLFEQLGLDYEMQLLLSGMLNIAQLVAVGATLVFLDRIGRRPMLLAGSAGLIASHTVAAAMIGVYSYDWSANPAQAWVGVGFIFGIMVSYGISWGPVPWVMRTFTLPDASKSPADLRAAAEIHVSSRRAKGVALATCSNWFGNFIVGLITPPLTSGSGGYGAFAFFACFCAVAALWTYFFVPETRGLTLEQMDRIFHSDQATEDAIAREEILQMICGEAQNPTTSSGSAYKGQVNQIEQSMSVKDQHGKQA